MSARASACQIGIQSAQISAIERDPMWQGGDYYDGEYPAEGLAAARRIAHLTYRGEMEIDERFGTSAQAGENPLGPYRKLDQRLDRKSTRLNSSHVAISYAVFCLKKKSRTRA